MGEPFEVLALEVSVSSSIHRAVWEMVGDGSALILLCDDGSFMNGLPVLQCNVSKRQRHVGHFRNALCVRCNVEQARKKK